MPQLIPVVISAVATAGAAVASAATAVGAFIWGAGTWVQYAIVASGAAFGMKLLTPKPNFNSITSNALGRMVMTRDTITSRRAVYGRLRVAGPMAYLGTTSDVGSDKNENLHMILALAGHETDGLDAIYSNDTLVVSGAYFNPDFTGKFDYQFKNGTPTQTSFVFDDPVWTDKNPPTSASLANISALYCGLVADQSVYPNGVPTITTVLRGKPVLDMDDITEIPACDNPALILRDYLVNYFGAAASEIDTDSFTTARDICDEIPSGYTEKRYRCNHSFTLDSKPAEVIQDILNTMYGKLIYSNGKFVVKAGAYYAPVYTINEDDLAGGVSITTAASVGSSFNAVQGKFIDGADVTSSYAPADFVPVTSSFYLNKDQGNYAVSDISLAGVTSHTQARRLAKITLLDARQDLVVSFPAKVGGLRMVAGDNVNLTLDRYGWDKKVFEIIELQVNPDFTTNFTLKETAAEIFDFPVDEDVDRDLSPNTGLPDPFFVSPPKNFTVTETTTKDSDGTIFPSVTMDWDSANTGSISDIEISYLDNAGSTYEVLGKFGNFVGTHTTLDVSTGKTYTFRARNFNYLGTPSAFVSQSITLSGSLERPQPPESTTVTGGTGSLSVTWANNAVDTDYASTDIWVNTTNASASADYQGSVSGTTWNRTITTSSLHYVWLKNKNTSGLESDVAFAGSASVASLGTGAEGPAGPSGSYNVGIYKRSPLVPTTPTGNLPVAGWTTTIPADDGNALWVSYGLVSGEDGTTLIGTWSTPARLSGVVSYYQTSAPSNGVNATLALGDLWFDSDDAFRVYRWDGAAWISVQDGTIPQLTGSLADLSGSLSSTDATVASINGEVDANTADVLALTGSVVGLQNDVLSLSSSYESTSGSVSADLNNIFATYATEEFAIAVSAYSASVEYGNATASAESYTNNTLVNYATKDFAVATSDFSASVAFNNATASANAYTDSSLTLYATEDFALTQDQQTSTASYNNATASFENTLTSYATQDYAQTTATNTVNASVDPGGVVSSSIESSVSTVSTALADLSGSVAAEYVLEVTAGNRVAGFRITNAGGGGGSSDFIVQSDKFQIVNTSGGQNKVPFLVDGTGVYIDEATIRSLDAGKITAGTVTVAVQLDAATLVAAKMSVNSDLFNSATPANLMPVIAFTRDDLASGGAISISGLSTHPTWTYQTSTSCILGSYDIGASGLVDTRIGQSTAVFDVNIIGNHSITASGSILFGGAYRKRTGGGAWGSWTNISHDNFAYFNSSNSGNIQWADNVSISGIGATDEIQFGVRTAKSGTPTGTIGGLSLSVSAPNM